MSKVKPQQNNATSFFVISANTPSTLWCTGLLTKRLQLLFVERTLQPMKAIAAAAGHYTKEPAMVFIL